MLREQVTDFDLRTHENVAHRRVRLNRCLALLLAPQTIWRRRFGTGSTSGTGSMVCRVLAVCTIIMASAATSVRAQDVVPADYQFAPDYMSASEIRPVAAMQALPPAPGYPQFAQSPMIAPASPYSPPTQAGFAEVNTPYYGADGVIRQQTELNWWDDEGWFERTLTDGFTNTWIRTEFMYWTTDRPADGLNGAPIRGIDDPTQPFTATDPVTATTFNVAVPDRSGLDPDGSPGLRFTYGVPMTFGAVEVSFFGLEQASDGEVDTRIADGIVDRLATSTLTAGRLGTNLQTYDISYAQHHASDLMGLDAVVVIDRNYFLTDIIEIKPIAGLRFIALQERFSQQGEFDNAGALVPPVTSAIISEGDNFVYGFAAGFRAEIEHPWFTLGVEPRLTLGVNSSDISVTTSNFRGVADGVVTSGLTRSTITGIFELKTYARIPIRNYLHLTFGYDLMYLPRVQRAASGIRYDDLGTTNPPAITAQDSPREYLATGFQLGLEFHF